MTTFKKPAHSKAPVANSAMVEFIMERMAALAGVKAPTEIAREIGYERPIMLTAFMTGDAKVPLDKAPALAKALNVDVSQFFRLALKQFWPGADDVINEISLVPPTAGSDHRTNEFVDTIAEIDALQADDDENGQGVNAPIGAGGEGPTSYVDLNFKVAPAFHRRFRMEAAKRALTMKELLIVSFEAFVSQGPRRDR